MKTKMINVGMILYYHNDWIGGVNYQINTLLAIKSLKSKGINLKIFSGTDCKKDIEKYYSQFAEINYYNIFNLNGKKSFLLRVFYKIKKRIKNFQNGMSEYDEIFKKHNIKILVNTNLTHENVKVCKIINWIPDFQHLHLQNMFSRKEIERRNGEFKKIINGSDIIILSSKSAYNDYKKFSSLNLHKAKVMHFTNFPFVDSQNNITFKSLREKYKLPRKFFYLPNQFWKHKNHFVVLKAILKLKQSGREIYVVSSGRMNDHRDPQYIKTLNNYIAKHKLDRNFITLHVIPYSEVKILFKHSIAVINPSLFEGWSTTVEEAKNINKILVLSNIKVHREQRPSRAFYFPPHDAKILSNILWDIWTNKFKATTFTTDTHAARLKKYIFDYERILTNLVSSNTL